MLSPREASVAFRSEALRSRADHVKQKLLHAVNLRNNRPEEKLLVDYGIKYSF